MANRAFNIAALVSAVLLGFTALLWLSAYFLNPHEHHLSITQRSHIGVWGGFDGPWSGRLVFFNDPDGPYRGSIIALSDADSKTPAVIWRGAWGDSLGVYYRHFYLPKSGITVWTLMISLLYPLGLFAILPLAWVWRRWRGRRDPLSCNIVTEERR
jgi:hypothetical protein